MPLGDPHVRGPSEGNRRIGRKGCAKLSMTNCCLQLQIDTCLIICYMHANLVAVTRVQMFPPVILHTHKRKRVREQNKKGQEWQLHDVFLPVIYLAWLTIFLSSPLQTEIFKLTEWASGQQRGEAWEKSFPSALGRGAGRHSGPLPQAEKRLGHPGYLAGAAQEGGTESGVQGVAFLVATT